MIRRLSSAAFAIAIGAASSGCTLSVIPGMLPTWAADTLGETAADTIGSSELETPPPVPLNPRSGRPVRPAAAEPPRGYAGGDEEATAWVETELKDRGLRFGTDGTVASLFTYVRTRHALVSAERAAVGDVVFFDLGGRNRCGDHAGVVDEVDATGRISFRESRGGVVRLSYAHPRQPFVRRALDGRVVNTFLRIRRAEDPPGLRYLAGSLLCGVGRIDRAVVNEDARRRAPRARLGEQGPGGGQVLSGRRAAAER
jgi:hypothetical protein